LSYTLLLPRLPSVHLIDAGTKRVYRAGTGGQRSCSLGEG
jgi:hypothetical protein